MKREGDSYSRLVASIDALALSVMRLKASVDLLNTTMNSAVDDDDDGDDIASADTPRYLSEPN